MIGKDGKVKILLGGERMNYKPSVDITSAPQLIFFRMNYWR